jgi:uncharacterized membrane protein
VNTPQDPHRDPEDPSIADEQGPLVAQARFGFSGPIPPPSILAGYENTLPGSADRIITMAEKQLGHRQKLEEAVVASNIQNEKVGMWFAFTLTLLLMSFGVYLIVHDKSIGGYLAIFAPAVFHGSNYMHNRTREEKSTDGTPTDS